MRWWVVHKRLSYIKEKSVKKNEYFSTVEILQMTIYLDMLYLAVCLDFNDIPCFCVIV